MNITHRTDKSLLTTILHFLIRPFGSLISRPGKPLPAGSPRLHPPAKIEGTCTITERKVHDIYIYDITAKETEPIEGKIRRIYYIAGGSFCQPPSSSHWAFIAELSTRIPNAVVSVISPPLAPHSPAPVTFPHLLRLYISLMTTAAPGGDEIITFAGDSSGGNLVLSMVLAALKGDVTSIAPDSVMLISPVVDLRFTNPQIALLEKKDPLLRRRIEISTAKSWAGHWDLSDPLLSPLLVDEDTLGALRQRGVKVHGVTGGYDILTPDTLLFQEMCRKVAIEGEWLIWEGQMHCFPIAFGYGLRESVEGTDWIVGTLGKDRWGWDWRGDWDIRAGILG